MGILIPARVGSAFLLSCIVSLMSDRALSKRIIQVLQTLSTGSDMGSSAHQTRTSFSGTFELSPKDTDDALQNEEGPYVFKNLFEVVSLDDMCNASPLRSEFGNQFFLRIGRWVDETWTMTLGMYLCQATEIPK
jgi:hypothetical protein